MVHPMRACSRRHALIAVLAASVLGVTTRALAADVTAALSVDGFRFLERELTQLIPSSLPIDSSTQIAQTCRTGDTEIEIKRGTLRLGKTSLSLSPREGLLRVELLSQLEGEADFTVEHPVPCLPGSMSCGVGVTLGAHVIVELATQIENGRAKLGKAVVRADVPASELRVVPKGCNTLEAWLVNMAGSYFKDRGLEKLAERIEEAVRQKVVPKLEATLAGVDVYTSHHSTSVGDFTLAVTPSALTISPEGLTAGLDVAVQPTSTPTCTLPAIPAPVAAAVAPPAFDWRGEELAVALSTDLLNRTLHEIWRGGAGCLGSLGGASSVAVLGGAQITALRPPTVTPVPGDGARLHLAVPQLQLTFGSGAKAATAIAALEGSARVVLNQDTRTAVLDIESLELTEFGFTDLVAAINAPLPADRLKDILNGLLTTVRAQYDERLAFPLEALNEPDSAFSGLYLYVDHALTTEQHILLYLRAFAKPASDISGPQTSWASDPPVAARPESLRLVAVGKDDLVPAPLLRFQWRIDGGAWLPTAPQYDRVLKTTGEGAPTLSDGNHVFEARAIDLHNNPDAKPVKANILIDSVAPIVAIDGTPVISAGRLKARFVVRDNVTKAAKIELSAQVERDGAAVVDRPYTPGLTALDEEMPSTGPYQLTVIARDEAGNVSAPQTVSFDDAGSGAAIGGAPATLGTGSSAESGAVIEGVACQLNAANHAPAARLPLLWLLGPALVLLLRRRRRRPSRQG